MTTPALKKHPLSAGVKRGLARAFTKFDAYALAKYDRANAIRLRDVLFLTHAKPKDAEQAALWKKLIAGELESPDTWEVALSGGAPKKETFERLITEGKLGGLALLRNLRNMVEAGVDETLVRERLAEGAHRALPFRFVAAAKYAPRYEGALEICMLKSAESLRRLGGRTLLVLDISGSMHHANISTKSEMTRLDAACALGMLVREVCEDPVIYATAGNDGAQRHATAEAPARRGFALGDAIKKLNSKLGSGGIFLVQCMEFIAKDNTNPKFDRVIVLTDEQDCDGMRKPSGAKKLGRWNYVINVSPHKNGIAYNNGWTQIDGWSEHVIDYVAENEILDESESISQN